jgi:spore germination cell wall hydrolase CwlJ-like protein
MQELALPSPRLVHGSKRGWLIASTLAGLVAVNLFAGASLIDANRASAKVTTDFPAATPDAPAAPEPAPLKFQAVAPQDAVAINAAVPIVGGPNPAAPAFSLSGAEGDKLRALDCLTAAVYYEAATEANEGQRAVAQVVLNRVRHPAYPSSVCGVVYQGSERSTGCQFTFTCDGSLRRLPMASYWERARKVAKEALAGSVYAPVGMATHYHTNWVVPYWSSSLTKLANVGTHIFYRWSGGWGKPAAFTSRYASAEPVIDLARLRTKAPAVIGSPVDLASAKAAQEAKDKAALEADMHSVDSFQRAVLRRYEPMPGSAVSAILAEQAQELKPRDKDAKGLRWAMTGDGLGTSGTPLGKQIETVKAEAEKAPAPACLSGVRKPGEEAASC